MKPAKFEFRKVVGIRAFVLAMVLLSATLTVGEAAGAEADRNPVSVEVSVESEGVINLYWTPAEGIYPGNLMLRVMPHLEGVGQVKGVTIMLGNGEKPVLVSRDRLPVGDQSIDMNFLYLNQEGRIQSVSKVVTVEITATSSVNIRRK